MGTVIAGIPAVMVTSTMLTLNCLQFLFFLVLSPGHLKIILSFFLFFILLFLFFQTLFLSSNHCKRNYYTDITVVKP